MRKPKLNPVANAKAVARHSWSFQLNAVAAVASAVGIGMSVLAGAPPSTRSGSRSPTVP